jgi:hypothetical protein
MVVLVYLRLVGDRGVWRAGSMWVELGAIGKTMGEVRGDFEYRRFLRPEIPTRPVGWIGYGVNLVLCRLESSMEGLWVWK